MGVSFFLIRFLWGRKKKKRKNLSSTDSLFVEFFEAWRNCRKLISRKRFKKGLPKTKLSFANTRIHRIIDRCCPGSVGKQNSKGVITAWSVPTTVDLSHRFSSFNCLKMWNLFSDASPSHLLFKIYDYVIVP